MAAHITEPHEGTLLGDFLIPIIPRVDQIDVETPEEPQRAIL